MEAPEEQIIQKTTDNEISASRYHYNSPGLRVLLSIKKNTALLEEDYSELLQIEGELNELNRNGLLIIEANTSPEAAAQWKAILNESHKAIKDIIDSLMLAKEMIAQKQKDRYPDLWKQLFLHIAAFKVNSKKASDSGLMLLPETIQPKWELEFVKPETRLVKSLVTHMESCRILLQMIERYSPDELNTITQIIVDHVPSDFTYEEAEEYENDYFKALANFKSEFKKDKNLWDKFLDILAGDTHQLPSEGAMMERWLDGEEADL